MALLGASSPQVSVVTEVLGDTGCATEPHTWTLCHFINQRHPNDVNKSLKCIEAIIVTVINNMDKDVKMPCQVSNPYQHFWGTESTR